MAEVISTQYTVREMLEAIRQAAPLPTFLQDLLVKQNRTHETRHIEIDTIVSSNTVAKYIDPSNDAEVVSKKSYSSKIHVIPYTRQRKVLTPDDLLLRMPGETVYSAAGSANARKDELMGEYLAELNNRVIRLEELQLAGALRTGTAVISGDGVNYTVTYGRDANNTKTLTADDRWGESSQDKVEDFRLAAEQMRKPGVDGGMYTDVVMGVAAATKWMADTAIASRLDNRRMELGEINPRTMAEQSASYLGTYRDSGINCDVYSYFGQYVDSGGTAQYFLDTNEVLFINSTMKCIKHYGMISNLKAGNFAVERFPLMVTLEDGSLAYVQLESAPLVATHEPNKCYRLKTYG